MPSKHLYEVISSFVFLEMRTLRYRQDRDLARSRG